MHVFCKHQPAGLTRLLLGWIAMLSAGLAFASAPGSYSAASLQAKYASLGERLHDNPFRRPVSLDSSESPNDVKGNIYALLDYPFSTVRTSLQRPEQWCDVLILHINTKLCRATAGPANAVLSVNVGKKTPQPVDEAYPLEFDYRVAAATPNHLAIELNAPEGPLSTRNYRIQLQAIPVGNRTFLHLTYSYDYGMAGRLAMKTYLATIGSGKVGFTRTGTQADGQPEHVSGMRGVVERNTMRYYLAIDAYLGALAAPPHLRLQKRLNNWFNATEQYPRQLRELDRAAYFDMKRREYQRQQAM